MSTDAWISSPGFSQRYELPLRNTSGRCTPIDRSGQHWCIAELHRVKGELLLHEAGDQSIPAAEDCFQRALGIAQEQGALFWELRAVLSLARWRIREDRQEIARQILAPVYDRFTEGFETADLKQAKALLEQLA